ncbi:hypothetical protein FAF44_30335 [Nonomuraea sp. MG754425]|nr:hypothetical protein [Nonomuraea sp. MG754425]
MQPNMGIKLNRAGKGGAHCDRATLVNSKKPRLSEAIRVALIGAVATVAAAVITVAFTMSDGQEAAPPPSGPPTGASSSPAAAPSQVFSLVDQPPVSDDDKESWQEQPLAVNGKTYDKVLSTSPCWLNDHFSVTFLAGKKYTRLTASVGIADTSPVPRPLKFSVRADNRTVYTGSAGLGQLRDVDVDIRDAIQVSIVVSTTSTQQCHGDTVGVWIDPQLR